VSGQRNRAGTRTAGLKARVPLAPMSGKREQALRESGRWQPGSTFARPAEARARETGISRAPGRRKETGFPPRVRLAVRTRAGNGDPGEAVCEGCGIWLGRYGGEIQHIRARGMGGSRERDSVTNGVLLCGPSTDKRTCHGKCEARDEHMREAGFWRKQSDPDVPVMLHGRQSGVLVWLTGDGGYQVARPGEEGA